MSYDPSQPQPQRQLVFERDKSGRIQFDILQEGQSFPFHLLRIGSNSNQGIIKSSYGGCHCKTFIESNPGVLEEYDLIWHTMKSQSITYYFDVKSPRRPSFYCYQEIHPLYPNKDTKGEKLKNFIVKFESTLTNLIEKSPPSDKGSILHKGLLNESKDKWITRGVRDQFYPETHKEFPNQIDKTKSEVLKCIFWTYDKPEEVKNRKSLVNVPNTDTLFFTTFYDVSPSKLKEETVPQEITEYNDIKRYIYSSTNHPNASGSMCYITSAFKIRCPSISFPKDKYGEVQYKISECIFSGCNEKISSSTIPAKRLQDCRFDPIEFQKQFGFVDIDTSSSSTIQNNPLNSSNNDNFYDPRDSGSNVDHKNNNDNISISNLDEFGNDIDDLLGIDNANNALTVLQKKLTNDYKSNNNNNAIHASEYLPQNMDVTNVKIAKMNNNNDDSDTSHQNEPPTRRQKRNHHSHVK
jgi:hypothetical protein